LKQPAKFPLDYLLYTEGEGVACQSRRSITVVAMTKADFIAWEVTLFLPLQGVISFPRKNITHIHKCINAFPVFSTNFFFCLTPSEGKEECRIFNCNKETEKIAEGKKVLLHLLFA